MSTYYGKAVPCARCGSVVSHVLKTRGGLRERECTRCKSRYRTVEVSEREYRYLVALRDLRSDAPEIPDEACLDATVS
jgi:hypothetical protein